MPEALATEQYEQMKTNPQAVEIASDGMTTIRTPNGNATVTKSTTDADVFMVTHGTAIKGARNYVE